MDDPALNGLQSEAGGAEKEGRQGLEGRGWGPERETMRSESGRPKETGRDRMRRCRDAGKRRRGGVRCWAIQGREGAGKMKTGVIQGRRARQDDDEAKRVAAPAKW